MRASAGEGTARRAGARTAGEGRLRPGVPAPPAETEQEQGAEGREVEVVRGERRGVGSRLKEERKETRGDSECNFVCLFVCSLIAGLGLLEGWRDEVVNQAGGLALPATITLGKLGENFVQRQSLS